MNTVNGSKMLDADGVLLPGSLKVQQTSTSKSENRQDGKVEYAIMAEKEENDTSLFACKVSQSHSNWDPVVANASEVCHIKISRDRETVESSSSFDLMDDDSVLGCQTPKENIFDPFATGAEELAFAPEKRPLNGSGVPLRRQLNFDLQSDPSEILNINNLQDAIEEDQLSDFLCKSIIKLLISNQSSEISSDELKNHHFEYTRTPSSSPLLTGIAETCPPAPSRPIGKSRVIDRGICRKLDFGTSSI